MRKRWDVTQAQAVDAETIQHLAQEAEVSPVVARMLLVRGMDNKDVATRFLRPETMAYGDPFLLRDMDKAVARLSKAIDAQEKIFIYGDYDVDGVTATSLLVRALRSLKANVDYFVPHRQKNGYGLSVEALEALQKKGAQLVVSVDCGITAVEEAAWAKERFDLVITDHHLPSATLPDAVAVVNPRREDCPYPYKGLAGVGVAFKLCQALWQQRGLGVFDQDLEIVTLGTIADVMPLLDENRKIVKEGLQRMKDTPCKGLHALLSVTGLLDKKLTAGHVGFVLGPRLNAAGRIASASLGVELLLTDDAARAAQIARELDADNQERQRMEKKVLEEAKRAVERTNWQQSHALVVAGENWHPGIIGIVASRLVEAYGRPTVVISLWGETGKGSCRSIKDFHMLDALTACKDYLLGFGGHAQAAGLSLRRECLSSFREALDAHAAKVLPPGALAPSLRAEMELNPAEITDAMMAEIELLEPYGMGNPKPVFAAHAVQGRFARRIGKDDQHLKFEVDGQKNAIPAVAWNLGVDVTLVHEHRVDFLYSPSYNEWQGNRELQILLDDLRLAEADEVITARNMREAYRFLLMLARLGEKIPADPEALASLYGERQPYLGVRAFRIAIQTFTELGLLNNEETRMELKLKLPSPKVHLEDSLTYRTAVLPSGSIIKDKTAEDSEEGTTDARE